MADEEEKGAISCKVVLIGESGVGKTSIISRYIYNTFSSVLMATPGANFTTKTVFLQDEKQSIKFEIWDTAGQEKYRALAKVFYKNAAVCILVYDITRRASFEELKKYWITELKANAAPSCSKLIYLIKLFLIFFYLVLALAGNKNDMYEHEEVEENEGKELAKVFYKNAAVCVLVYDITRKSSFEEIKNYWVKEIKENAPQDISK